MKEETLRLILQSEHGAEAFSKWINLQYAFLITKIVLIGGVLLLVYWGVNKFLSGDWTLE